MSAYDVDPFDVPLREKVALLGDWSSGLLAKESTTCRPSLMQVKEQKFYADSAGTVTTQQRVRVHPALTAMKTEGSAFDDMRTLAPPVGRGYEYLTGTGWDFPAELAELPRPAGREAGRALGQGGHLRPDRRPSNLWLTIHESIGHATELDRALGYEAAYAGTSFATFDQLEQAHLRLPDHERHRRPHGRTRPGQRRLGRRGRRGPAVRHRARRHPGRLPARPADGPAQGPGPLERLRVRRLARRTRRSSAWPTSRSSPPRAARRPRSSSRASTTGSTSWATRAGRSTCSATTSSSPASASTRSRTAELAGQLRDVAYQATTTDFWRSMDAVGGPQTYVLGGAFNCGKGQPGQVAPVSHGCPSGPVPRREDPQHGPGGRASDPAGTSRARPGAARRRRPRRHRRRRHHRQPAVRREHPDDQRRGPGLPADRRLDRRAPGPAWSRARASRPIRSPTWWARPTRRRATRSRPRTRARSVAGDASADWDRPAEETSIAVFRDLAPALGEAFAAAEAGGRQALRLRRTPGQLGLRRHQHRPAPPPRPAHRPPGAQRQVARHDPLGVGRRGHPRLHRRRHRRPRRDAGPAPRMGQAQGRPGPGPLRDPAAARRGGRPDDLPLLVGGRPRRLRRPHGASPSPAAAPASARSWPSCRSTSTATPRGRGVECGGFTVAHASSREQSVFDNGFALGRPGGSPTASWRT